MVKKTNPITITLDRRVIGEGVDIAEDPRLHALNAFIDALNEGMREGGPDVQVSADNLLSSMVSAFLRKASDNNPHGHLFSLNVSSHSKPGSNVITWSFDFSTEGHIGSDQ